MRTQTQQSAGALRPACMPLPGQGRQRIPILMLCSDLFELDGDFCSISFRFYDRLHWTRESPPTVVNRPKEPVAGIFRLFGIVCFSLFLLLGLFNPPHRVLPLCLFSTRCPAARCRLQERRCGTHLCTRPLEDLDGERKSWLRGRREWTGSAAAKSDL